MTAVSVAANAGDWRGFLVWGDQMKTRVDRVTWVLVALFSLSCLVVGALARADRMGLVAGVLCLVAVGLAAIVGLRVVARRSANVRARLGLLAMAVASTTIALVMVELGLRLVVRTRATYGEANGSPYYRSLYRYDNPTWYHTGPAGSTLSWAHAEFSHERTYNSLGLAERELPPAKRSDEYRVLALGDSFTEGVGGSYDESWVKAFERSAVVPGDRTVSAINAGVSGSDPFFEFVLFRDRLAELAPDLVIVGINTSDVTDVITRGGSDRFQKDGTTRAGAGPWWDPVYGASYITRHVVHDLLGYSWLLLRPADLDRAQAAAMEKLQSVLTDLARRTRERGAVLVVVANPHEYELLGEYYNPPAFEGFMDRLAASGECVVLDLRRIFRAKNVITRDNSREYYWKLDLHFTPKGYQLMGQTIALELARRGVLQSVRVPGF